MKPEVKRYTATVGTRTVTFETGKLAAQAGGAVTVGIDDSIVFAAATMGGVREGIDFFPLSVEYEERLYAGGKIPGSFFRREGRPSTDAILTARLTDRPLRPLFQHGMRNEVQVMMFSLSADSENPLDILAINAASAAIMISDIPWGGPVGAVRVGRVDGRVCDQSNLYRDGRFGSRPAHRGNQRRDPHGRVRGKRNSRRCDGCRPGFRSQVPPALDRYTTQNGRRSREAQAGTDVCTCPMKGCRRRSLTASMPR